VITLDYASSQGLELFPFQRSGVDLMKEMVYVRKKENEDGRGGVLVFDEMGLGKTIEAITFIAEMEPQPRKVLVICPNTLKREWERALVKWLPPEMAIYLTTKGSLRRFYGLLEHPTWATAATRIMITNYETLRSKDYMEILQAFNPEVIVWDEVHRLRNWEKKTARASRELTAPTEILLTGTPVVNHAGDYWSLVNRVSPLVAGRPDQWDYNFTFQRSGYMGTRKMGIKNTGLLKSLLSKVAIQRKKADVLKDLPPKVYREVPLDMEKEQREVYEKMERDLFILIDSEGNSLQASSVLAQMTRLRQLCCDPRIVGVEVESPIEVGVKWEEGLVPYRPDYKPGAVELLTAGGEVLTETHGVRGIKTEFLLGFLEDIGDSQVVVFSNFERYISLIESLLIPKGYSIGRLTGKESPDVRDKTIEGFRNGNIQLILGTTQAGGEGVNLQAASTVVLLDKWWSPVRNDQAIDRLHRIGQQYNVQVVLPHCVETIDDAMKEILDRKYSVINETRIQGDTVELLREWRERRLGGAI
jgi:SNF2 family DNA or RNA helicase